MAKIKNKFLFKRGGYAVLAIAIVLTGAILINLLTSFLAKRIDLEYDLTSDKKHSISEENAEYIKTVDKEINIYVMAASASEYYGGYMNYYANQMGYTVTTGDYYEQTTKFLEKYADLNKNIKVTYMDPYGTQMAEISTKYPESFMYGDILVTCSFTTSSGAKLDNYRNLTLTDIYTAEDTSGMASMGYDYYYINGSCLETSLTSAVASVISEETKKIAFLATHSKAGIFDYFKGILELNNFKVDEISGDMLKEIPQEYDAAVLVAPVMDFTKEELNALSVFLEGNGKLGKTLMFYGDTGYQNLPNLYNFLGEWGIAVEKGIVFETNDGYYMDKNHATYMSLAQSNSPFTIANAFISGYNVPMYENGENYGGRTTETIIGTNGTSVIVPVSTDPSVAPSKDLEKRKLSNAIIATDEDFDNDTDKSIFSRVIAFSSIDFISQEYIEKYGSTIDYKLTALNALRYATGLSEKTITFENKTIDATSELYVTSSSSVKVIRIIFIGILPLAVLAAAFAIFFIRRNK